MFRLAALTVLAALAWTIRSRRRRLGRAGVVLAVVFAASSAVLLVHPFLPREQPPPAEAGLEMTVTMWKTADRLRAEGLLSVFRERDPDVLVMPETTASTVEDIVGNLPELPLGVVGLEPMGDPTRPLI